MNEGNEGDMQPLNQSHNNVSLQQCDIFVNIEKCISGVYSYEKVEVKYLMVACSSLFALNWDMGYYDLVTPVIVGHIDHIQILKPVILITEELL